MHKPAFIIDGARISTLDAFYREIERSLIPRAAWGRNLDALHDILRGGFGTPEGGFVLCWTHSDRSRVRLGQTFDTLVAIIREHGPDGSEPQNGVELRLL